MILIIKICRDFNDDTIYYFSDTIASFFRKHLKNVEVTYTIATMAIWFLIERKLATVKNSRNTIIVTDLSAYKIFGNFVEAMTND